MKRIYFIGIGGAAMGNVALALAALGIEVSGSDQAVYPPMSNILQKSDIIYYEGYDEKNIKNLPAETTIVVGNAISRGNVELEYALDNRLPMISMAELAGRYLIGNNTSVVISGTHGKTSVSSLTAWLLETCGERPGYFIGGVPGNYSSGCRASENGIFVSEGDEYDSAFFDKRSKFLHYRPDIAVINNIEFDHADIFDSLDDIIKSFKLFARLVPKSGVLLINAASKICREIAAKSLTNVQTFGIEPDAVWRAIDIEYAAEGTTFTLMKSAQETARFTTPLFGEMNVRNSVAAIAAAISAMETDAAFRNRIFSLDSAVNNIQKGFTSFKLPKRRLEIIGEWRGAIIVDDFAHHPTAIAETLVAAKQKFPSRRIIACFEPRSNTTTRAVFQNELAECFSGASVVVFAPLNRPERYAEADRLDINRLKKDLENRSITAYSLPQSIAERPDWGGEIARLLQEIIRPNDAVVLLSNGNFGGVRSILR
ncbi:MAG: UDP-N-acetylmuramate--alanine ligase [Bacteroidetes bacterium]|nr:UDP-N-acetylmuramate--alanine ligase [Bacteroidota bacterium]